MDESDDTTKADAGHEPEMRQALTANRMKVSMLGDAVEAGMLPIGLTDAAFTTFSGGIAYMAAKKIAMKEGLSDELWSRGSWAALDKAVGGRLNLLRQSRRALGRFMRTLLGAYVYDVPL